MRQAVRLLLQSQQSELQLSVQELQDLKQQRVALRGHQVTIFEKSLQIGGQLLIASVPPRKEEMMRSINYYLNVLPELSVTFPSGSVNLPEKTMICLMK